MKTPLSLVALCLVGTFVFASSLPDSPKPAASRESIKLKREKRFSKLDANNDTFVDREEFNKCRPAVNNPARAAKRFTRSDKNSDSKLSKEEWLSAPAGGKKRKTSV